ncbi:cytochrome b [Bosea vestrisii]|uniref:cytochrome b n=1 Tax=Bosea vestrisii TaxID=151416 RepID=UPI0024DFEB59|nr:cytochrome b [Bosea vestrisii]WID97995.1 cytochrome b [Bosea vestrisii]
MTQRHDEVTAGAGHAAVYSAMARRLHWITAAAVFVMVPLGLAMTYRGNTLDIWDGVTDALYSTHKLLGFLVLWLSAGRLIYRLMHGAPPDEPTLEWWQKAASHLVHWALYGLLLIVPLLGWIGISLFPSLTVFGLFDLPALAPPNEDAAKRVLFVHGWLAILLALLVCGHIAAALFHHVIRKDGVLRRMLPGLK